MAPAWLCWMSNNATLAAYRHIGDNMKVGVGYNVTDFDDDLGSTDFDFKGWFINLIGKY